MKKAASVIQHAYSDPKPLYLDPIHAAQVQLDGPALRVAIPGQVDALFPLRRLSRIIVNSRTKLSTEVLLACAARGITLLLVEDGGTVCARVLGCPGERQELRQRLVDLLACPDWRDRYGDWQHAVGRQLRTELQRRLRAPLDCGLGKGLDRWVHQQASWLAGPEDATNSRNWLQQTAMSWMVQHLAQLGFAADSELAQDGCPDLATDLTLLLMLHLEPIRLGWLRRRWDWGRRQKQLLAPLTRHDMVGLWERHAQRLDEHGRALTQHLHRWLVEIA